MTKIVQHPVTAKEKPCKVEFMMNGFVTNDI